MTSKSFNLYVTYSQIAVFDPGLRDPFNDWRSQHVAQGFSWRPGSVSFRTLNASGALRIEVQIADRINLRPDAERALVVPFLVGQSGLIEVASISAGEIVNIPEGQYGLVFETAHDEDGVMWCRLTFVPGTVGQAEVLRADAELSPTYPLLMETHPA